MDDILEAKNLLEKLPKYWEGKECVLELKEADFNWRQMEWWGFYFEYLCRKNLKASFKIPGDRINNVSFDAKRTINWDFKAKAIKSDDHRAILNDCEAMDISIRNYGSHGVIIALCDVEYNDSNRTFQKWHTDLKGGVSEYEKDRMKRTSVSRYRKVRAELVEVIYLIVDERTLNHFDIFKQGINSNGKLRPLKYMLNLENIVEFQHEIVEY